MHSVLNAINFLSIAFRVFKYFYRKKKLPELIQRKMKTSFEEWGLSEDETPKRIKAKFKKSRVRRFWKRHR